MRTVLRVTTFLFTMLAVGATVALAQIRINEVSYSVDFQGATTWVELHNTGTADVDVSSYWLCNFPNYSEISTLNVLEGNTVIPGGGFLVVEFSALGEGDGEVGLYEAEAFGDANAMLDYMQYGSDGHMRESVAVTAGVWDAGAVVADIGDTETFSYFGGGATSAEDWDVGQPTAGQENVVATAIDEPDEIVDTFHLSPAYPNPFNPSTHFTLTLAAPQHVTIEVYDLLGRQVRTLADGELPAQQSHTFTFEPSSNAPSGLYLIRVEGEFFTAIERVLLLK